MIIAFVVVLLQLSHSAYNHNVRYDLQFQKKNDVDNNIMAKANTAAAGKICRQEELRELRGRWKVCVGVCVCM